MRCASATTGQRLQIAGGPFPEANTTNDRITNIRAACVRVNRRVQQDDVVAIPRSAHAARVAQNNDVLGFALDDDEMQRIAALKRPNGRVVNSVGRVSAWDA
jgi:diketogulonate reductase-like aldo/keto reductase